MVDEGRLTIQALNFESIDDATAESKLAINDGINIEVFIENYNPDYLISC